MDRQIAICVCTIRSCGREIVPDRLTSNAYRPSPLKSYRRSCAYDLPMMLGQDQRVGWGGNSKGGRASAYVLDDEPGVAALVGRALKLAGLDVKDFTDPGSCMSLTRMRPPQLLVLDLALGKTDAVEIIRQLEALCFRGTVLLMSGRYPAMLQDIERIGVKHGLAMLRSLQKPFGLSDVHERIKEMQAAKIADNARSEQKSSAACEHRLDLADALRKNWLELWYQPKVSLRGLTVSGAEAPGIWHRWPRPVSAAARRPALSAAVRLRAASIDGKLEIPRRERCLSGACREHTGVKSDVR
jgi:FixJ family two-component response regulator